MGHLEVDLIGGHHSQSLHDGSYSVCVLADSCFGEPLVDGSAKPAIGSPCTAGFKGARRDDGACRLGGFAKSPELGVELGAGDSVISPAELPDKAANKFSAVQLILLSCNSLDRTVGRLRVTGSQPTRLYPSPRFMPQLQTLSPGSQLMSN
jgi:hypothetical protein